MPPETEGWDAWGKHVLAELDRLAKGQASMQTTLSVIQVSVAKLKIKAGVWGAVAGMVPVAVLVILWAVSK